MTRQSTDATEANRREQENWINDDRSGEAPAGDEMVVDDPGNDTGQVLGRSVPINRAAAEAAPGSPESGAVRTEDGRPSADKPYT